MLPPLQVPLATLLALCSVGGARGAAAPYARAEPPPTMLPVHLAAGASSACAVCGKNDAGTANCCSEGGAWHGSCGDGAEHTWQAGFNACNGAAVQEAAADQTAPGPEPTAGGGPRDASLSCSACGTNGAESRIAAALAALGKASAATERSTRGKPASTPATVRRETPHVTRRRPRMASHERVLGASRARRTATARIISCPIASCRLGLG